MLTDDLINKGKLLFSSKVFFNIYLIILFLFLLPPIYLVPIRTFFSTSHTVGSLLIVFMFGFYLLDLEIKEDYGKKNSIILASILLYIIAQSLSIINVVNIVDFIKIYKNIILAIMFFLISVRLLRQDRIKTLFEILVIATVLNILIELTIYLDPHPLLSTIFGNIFYEGYWKIIELEKNMGKYFIGLFDSSLIPIIFGYFLLFRKEKKIILPLIITGLIFLLSTVSNYRIIFLVSLFSFLSSIVVFNKIRKFFLILIMFFILTFIYVGYLISNFKINTNVLNRMLFQGEDLATVESRIIMWGKSLDIGQSSLIYGIGLGNYADYSAQKKLRLTMFKWQEQLAKEISKHPHNIFFATFAETGLLGLFSLFFLMAIFLRQDFRLFRAGNKIQAKLAIISFWSLFISSLTGPRVTLPYSLLFWLMRAVIIKEATSGN